VVKGASGDDGNRYQVSTDDLNTRIFAYSWTMALQPNAQVHVFPYVPAGTSSLTQWNFDLDNSSGSVEGVLVTSPRFLDAQPIPASGLSDNAQPASSALVVPGGAGEDNTTWTVQYRMTADFSLWNDFRIRFIGQSGDVAIFISPTYYNPPPGP